MNEYRIAVIAGDGIGKEVIPAVRLYYEEFAWGTDYYMEHGMMMPRDTLNHNSLKTTVPLLQISNQQSQ